jgi:hypothetical protein
VISREVFTVDDLQRMPEWEHYPDAVVLRTDGADEGAGHGFDNLNPSAYTRAYLRTAAPWTTIVEWYRGRLASLGWEGREDGDSLWLARSPGESMVIVDCSPGTGGWDTTRRWIPNELEPGQGTIFSVYFSRSSGASRSG